MFGSCLHPLTGCPHMFSPLTRRIDDDMGRTHELEHSAIKCMRGILYCYMRQADKVSVLDQPPLCSCFQGCMFALEPPAVTHCVTDQTYTNELLFIKAFHILSTGHMWPSFISQQMTMRAG